MLYCANMRGDSDSVCAVVGQLAGAVYGLEAIPKSWIDCVEKWDGGGTIKLRGYKLFKLGKSSGTKSEAKISAKESKKSPAKSESKRSLSKSGKAEAVPMDTTDQAGAASGYAEAIHSCEHAAKHIAAITPNEAKLALVDVKCKTCKEADQKNLWVCMATKEVFCGRFAQGCMLKYAKKEGHNIAMCLGDLSFWCYACDSYLHHLTIRPVYDAYNAWHQGKFGEPLAAPFNKP